MTAAVLGAVGLGAVGGYFDRTAMVYQAPPGGARGDLVAVYFSDAMGGATGPGEGVIAALQAHGVPVVAVNSPSLFRFGRDRVFVDALVARAMRLALLRSGAARVVLVGSAFGADVLDTGLGAVPANLRARIASVVLLGPGRAVYFHADPIGLLHVSGPDSDPRRTVRMLHGLPVTCVFGLGDRGSLCPAPELAGARRIGIDDGHLLLRHYRAWAQQATQAALFPPAPMH
ncbi:MAG TPA: type IV secretion system protein VirJ [Novosphingobium capsulatum]|nr:type IV secretion system protein VirJ [Novosphingobium capsulatum]